MAEHPARVPGVWGSKPAASASWSSRKRARRYSPPARGKLSRCALPRTRASYSRRFSPSTSRLREECRLCSCCLHFYVRRRLVANERADLASQNSVANAGGLVHVEHHDRNPVVHAKTERSRVHDLQTPRKRFGESKTVEPSCIRVLVRIAIVNAINLRRFQDDISANLARPQSCGCVGGKVRITGTGGENDDAIQLKMPNGAPEDERFGHISHIDGGLHAGLDTHLVECAAQRERVDNCGKHAHIIGGGTVHPAM